MFTASPATIGSPIAKIPARISSTLITIDHPVIFFSPVITAEAFIRIPPRGGYEPRGP
jgi:hypothetical protein